MEGEVRSKWGTAGDTWSKLLVQGQRTRQGELINSRTRRLLRTLDGGYVHSSAQTSRRDGWFEVIAGKSMPTEGAFHMGLADWSRGQHSFVDQHRCSGLCPSVLNPSSALPPTVCLALADVRVGRSPDRGPACVVDPGQGSARANPYSYRRALSSRPRRHRFPMRRAGRRRRSGRRRTAR